MAKRRYSLFGKKDGDRKWTQLSKLTYPKELAVRIFQNALLAPFLGPADEWMMQGYVKRELRPVKEEKIEACGVE